MKLNQREQLNSGKDNILESIKKELTLKKLEYKAAQELKKTSIRRLLEILSVLFVSLMFLGIVKTIQEYRGLDPMIEQVLFFVLVCVVCVFCGFVIWLTGKWFKNLQVPFFTAVHIGTLSLTAMISYVAILQGSIFIAEEIPVVGDLLSTILLFALYLFGPISAIVYGICMKVVLKKYSLVVKSWFIGQVLSVVLIFGSAILFLAVIQAIPYTPSETITYYTATTMENAEGTLLTMNLTEGSSNRYCTVQLGKEWILMSHDPQRDRVRLPNDEWKIYSNTTRRFTNENGEELTFTGVGSYGGNFYKCVSGFFGHGRTDKLIEKGSKVCSYYQLNETGYYFDAYYENSRRISYDFELKSRNNRSEVVFGFINRSFCERE